MTKPLPVRTIRITDRSREVRSLPRGGLDALVQVEDVAHGWRRAEPRDRHRCSGDRGKRCFSAGSHCKGLGPPERPAEDSDRDTPRSEPGCGSQSRQPARRRSCRAEAHHCPAPRLWRQGHLVHERPQHGDRQGLCTGRGGARGQPRRGEGHTELADPGSDSTHGGLGGRPRWRLLEGRWRRPEDAADPGMWDRYGS